MVWRRWAGPGPTLAAGAALALSACSAKPYTAEMVCDDFSDMARRRATVCGGDDALVEELEEGFESLTCAVVGPDDPGVSYIDDYWHDTCIIPLAELDCAVIEGLGADVALWLVAPDSRCVDLYGTASDTGSTP